MMSNNGLMTCKSKYLSFINKGIITILLLGLSLTVIIPCSYLVVVYCSQMPIFIKIFWPILSAIVFIGTILTPLNGMIITKKGTILFLPDFRFKKTNAKDLKRLAIVFTEWENNKYSVVVKFVYEDGRVFRKDYSKQFRNIRNKKLVMSMYTITKRKVEKICNRLSDISICVVTVISFSR